MGGQISLASIKLNNAQTFNVPNASTALTVTSAIDTNARQLTLTGAGVHQISGIISGTGSVTKTGAGTAILAGNNTYSGLTQISSGTLFVNGSQPNSDVLVQNNSTLGGTGTVGRIDFSTALPAASSIISPGVSGAGILSTNGNVTFTNDNNVTHTLKIDINGATPGTGHDQLNVTGNVDLGSRGKLEVTIGSGFTPAAGNTFVIINNDSTDAVNGTFNGLPEGAIFTPTGRRLRISYVGGDGNDVTFTVLSAPTKREAVGADASAIQATVDQFRADLGGANNGVGGSFSSGRREINWDGVPDNFSAPANLPPDFFNVNSPRGAVFGPTGTTFQVSMDNDTPTDADPDQVRFDNLNPAYSAQRRIAFDSFVHISKGVGVQCVSAGAF